MGNSKHPTLHRMANSTDGHARIIHNAIMSHPACEFIKLGAMFESVYTYWLAQGNTIPVSRAIAATFMLEVMDGIAYRLDMIIPAREPLPDSHQRYKGKHPAHYRRKK